MQFIDHTGHIFSMPSYPSNPIGYEFEETDYVFWFDAEYSWKLSVGAYYMKPIRVLAKMDSMEVAVDSDKFFLLGSKTISKLLDTETNTVRLDESMMQKHLTSQGGALADIEIVSGLSIDEEDADAQGYEPWSLGTFYAVCKSDEPGTWETNILVTIVGGSSRDYCPITVGAEIVDECEPLVINGKNVGIDLPKDILKAMYQTNPFADAPDESLFTRKMKELLMNYMLIKGEEGNYKSALAALKWFGWGDKLKVHNLLRTDNELIAQYLRDYFDISNDVIETYKYFRNDALLSVSLPLTYEGDEVMFEFPEEAETWEDPSTFWGEGKPSVEDAFGLTEEVRYDEALEVEDDIVFYKNYFDFTFNELGVKLVFLKYYYEKYFLPVHMHINSMSMSQQVWMNDLKMIDVGYGKITAQPIFIHDANINVQFPPVSTLFFGAYKEVMDENFNVFSDTEELAEANKDNPSVKYYYAYDTLVEIPIKFTSENDFQLYDVILSLYKEEPDSRVKSLFTVSGKAFAKDYTTNIPHGLSAGLTIEYNGRFGKVVSVRSDTEFTLDSTLSVSDMYNARVHINKDYRLVYTSNFVFTQVKQYEDIENDDDTVTTVMTGILSEYQKFILHPKTMNTYIDKERTGNQFDINYWLSSHYKLTIYVNGNNYEYLFELKMPEMNLCMGTLEYKYDERFKQLGDKTLSTFTVTATAGTEKYFTDNAAGHGLHAGDYVEWHDTAVQVTDAEYDWFTVEYTLNPFGQMNNEHVHVFKKDQMKMQAFMHMPGLVTVNNIDIMEDLYFFQDSLGDYVEKYYHSTSNIMGRAYMNRCHMYKILDIETEKEVQATDANGSNTIKLFGRQTNDSTEYLSIDFDNAMYKKFFTKEGGKMTEVSELFTELNPTSAVMHRPSYDAFLMIEGKNTFEEEGNINSITADISYGNWYMILISKDTADGYLDEELAPPFTSLKVSGYELKYERSDFKFLINRYILKPRDYKYLRDSYGNIKKDEHGNPLLDPNYGIYHFNSNDLVAFYLLSNEKLPYKVGLSTKWEVKPMSIGMSAEAKIESPNEIAIVGVGGANFRYERGYYTVTCRFSLDDYVQHTMHKTAKFRID